MPHPFERRIWLSVPHMGPGERSYVDEAFRSNWMSTVGPNLSCLESEFEALAGRPALAVTNGTAAIHLGVKLLGIGAGDEVVTPTLTFAASCNPVRYEGGIPILLDSERQTWGIDPNLLAEFLERRARINRLPKAVIAVHLFGQGAQMAEIGSVCGRYEVPILEDAAESLGALQEGRHLGSFGDVAAYSFNGNKIITGAGGGILTCARRDWLERARHWATQARDEDPEGVRNYIHSELGYNYRLSNVLAGIVRGQLEVLEERVAQRRAVFQRYARAFADVPGLEAMPEYLGRGAGPSVGRSTRYLSGFLVDAHGFGMNARELIRRLDAANVEARPVWRPMHLQPLYRLAERVGGSVAEDLHARGILLPSSSSLPEEEQEFVIGRVVEAHRESMSQRGGVGLVTALS